MAERAIALARDAARACGLDPSGAYCMRERSSTIVALPAAAAIARVETPERLPLAERMATIARAIAPLGAPLAPLLAPERQPVITRQGAVTLWRRVEGRHARPDEYERVGQLLRRWHEVSRPIARDPALPRYEPFTEIELWLRELELEGYRPQRLAALQALTRSHAETWDELWAEHAGLPELDRVVVHGDVHHENVLIGPARACFVDLDMSGVAPAAWDLASVAASVHRYGVEQEVFEALVRGYGSDPRASPHFDFLQALYEFACAMWALSCRRVSPELAAEAELRISTVLGESEAARWTLM